MARRIGPLAVLLAATVATVVYAESHTVSQKAKAFSVSSLTVKPGETLTFKNDDEITHNVFSSTKGMEFNLKAQPPGGSAQYFFPAEGVAEVRCAFHPAMKLTVTVKK
jgi:plastocyanin